MEKFMIGQFMFDYEHNKLYFKHLFENATYSTLAQAESVIEVYLDAYNKEMEEYDLELDGSIRLYFISKEEETTVEMTIYASNTWCEGIISIIKKYCQDSKIPLKLI